MTDHPFAHTRESWTRAHINAALDECDRALRSLVSAVSLGVLPRRAMADLAAVELAHAAEVITAYEKRAEA